MQLPGDDGALFHQRQARLLLAQLTQPEGGGEEFRHRAEQLFLPGL